MTAIELSARAREKTARYDFLGTLIAGWRAMRRHRQERRELVALSRRTPRVIRDMGFDPEEIYAALNSSWDEVDPARFHSHLPKKEKV
ncbi:hypothetical protein ATN84_13580 [Paramesorhizobium deserti]|uniref:YjiS-like domain-containing protein n=1 Tax=Paramesorhizobium deserti TaxID=1494590 RepID=A0A135HV16_9HYPH|nr:DUF1127 domain-containing protein [Paramesorhizobium deserti]KXF77011.1 hypothetical protein ATN84_13580 [Paramesorhizobium deserti]